jgi:hypothetical protein
MFKVLKQQDMLPIHILQAVQRAQHQAAVWPPNLGWRLLVSTNYSRNILITDHHLHSSFSVLQHWLSLPSRHFWAAAASMVSSQ